MGKAENGKWIRRPNLWYYRRNFDPTRIILIEQKQFWYRTPVFCWPDVNCPEMDELDYAAKMSGVTRWQRKQVKRNNLHEINDTWTRCDNNCWWICRAKWDLSGSCLPSVNWAQINLYYAALPFFAIYCRLLKKAPTLTWATSSKIVVTE
jgi:hypothetical protein